MRFAVHLVQLLRFVLVAAGPLPLAVRFLVDTEAAGIPPSAAERLLGLSICWCFLQALVAILLALAGCFTAPGVLVAELLLITAGGVAVAPPARRRQCRAWWRALPPPGFDGSERCVLLALAAVGLVVLWWTAAVPVADFDSWAFHMPAMAQWLQTGTFTRLAQYLSRYQGSYPYSWEALCALFLTPFGEDVLVTSPNLIAWLMLGVATYLLGRDFGAARVHALAAAALLLVLPGVITPINSMHVDLPFAALFVAAAHAVIAWRRSASPRPLLLAILAAGLSAGIRSTAPAYILLLFITIAVLRLPRPRWRESQPAEWRTQATVAVCGGAALLMGGFWYAKNFIELGSPLGASAVQLGGVTVFPGVRPMAELTSGTLAQTGLPWSPAAWAAVIERATGELGLPFALLAALAVVGVFAVIARRGPMHARETPAFWVLLLGTGALFWITPFGAYSGIQLRLGFPFIALVAVSAAVGATVLRLRAEILATVVVLCAALVISQSKMLAPAVGALVAWDAWTRLALSRRRWIGAVALAVAIAAATFAARERRDRQRVEFYGKSYEFLEQHMSSRAIVGSLLTRRTYLLYGRWLDRRVVYTPFDAERPAEWLRDLRARVDAVALGPDLDTAAVESVLRVLDSEQSGFVRVSGASPGEMVLYRAVRSGE